MRNFEVFYTIFTAEFIFHALKFVLDLIDLDLKTLPRFRSWYFSSSYNGILNPTSFVWPKSSFHATNIFRATSVNKCCKAASEH